MQQFTIRDIEHLTGIKAHTLRIWEQRYGILIPKRKESLHRIYDNEDLKELLRISFLYHNGWKISKIASLNKDDIVKTIAGTEIDSKTYKSFIVRMIEAAIDFNEASFTDLLNELIGSIGFESCIVNVCYPYLERIGLLWLTNNAIPAQEHFSSYIIQNRIIAETEKLAPKTSQPEMVLFSPKGEYHELPLLFINYLLRKNGWNVVYLGSSVDKAVVQELRHPTIRYFFVHLITN